MIYTNKKLSIINELEGIFKLVKSELNQQNDKLVVNLNFVNQNQIRGLNKDFRKIDRETDVLSFPLLEGDFSLEGNPFDIDYDTGELCLGDIYICKEVADAQAKEYNHSVKREVCYLFIHGLLHLFGFDHIKEEDKEVMREKEEKILNLLNITREGE